MLSGLQRLPNVLITKKRPVDSNDPFVREALERLGKDQISGILALLETDDAEVCSTLALQDCHDAVIL